MRRSLFGAAAIAGAVTVAAFASSGAAGYSPAPSVTRSAAKVELTNTKLGKVLADGSGRTLYLFEKDKGPRSTCFGACASAWPPLTTNGKPTAIKGVSASKLGTINRGNGVKQVTYNGHPLYRFIKDTGPRQTHGEGLKAFGAEWYALSAAGKKVEEAGS
jgi:predicted lipoprotein with Yx(FWY)xxD motif